MFANNKHCNLIPAVTGIFLHSCNAPERVIDAIWRMDASISVHSINLAINSLSKESSKELRRFGQSMLVGYTLDNFDVNFKHSTGTVDQLTSNLVHLTSGLILNVAYASIPALKCSSFLWERSKVNDKRKYPTRVPDIKLLYTLHKETVEAGALNQKEDFARWKFAMDLCTYGPPYFHQFRDKIPPPVCVDSVPLFKTESMPLRSMNYQNSTVDGNISAIEDCLEQTGVNDIPELINITKITDIEDTVILFHGDLGTWERIQSAQSRRALDLTPRSRLQFIVFIPGLFHVKIACADAIWRMFVKPSELRKDTTSMSAFIQLFYPKLTSKINNNKAGFRVFNDCIVRMGLADRLECLRVLVGERYPDCDSLEKLAALRLTLADVLSLSSELALKHASTSGELEKLRFAHRGNRDYQFENTMMRIDYILLYEETSYAIRAGDIGRVETCLRRWIPIFKATGKHKYANNLLEFLTDLHFVYPEGLKEVVRNNWLCNPSGKPMGFRGVDWLLEVNNLSTKVTHGGSGSNYTVNRILNESVLVELYRDCKKAIEQQFLLTPKTMRHGEPDLTETVAAMSQLAQNVNLICYKTDGRSTEHQIPNYYSAGKIGRAHV